MTAPRRLAARTLAAQDYWDPDVHALERAGVFGQEWLCLGPSAAVADSGAYLADCVAGWPVLVVRDEGGVLRGFHNVCRHRAGPLVDDGPGRGRAFVCRYHGWSYELDGSLRSARDAGLDSDELDGLGLLELRAAEWRGLLFVNMDPGAQAIEHWLGDGFIAQCAA